MRLTTTKPFLIAALGFVSNAILLTLTLQNSVSLIHVHAQSRLDRVPGKPNKGRKINNNKMRLRRSDVHQPPKRAQVVIVGAGAAGLGAANHLRRRGLTDIMIVEASSEIGGRTKKLTGFVDYPLDLGASFVPRRFKNELRVLTGNENLPLSLVPNVTQVFGRECYVWNNYTYWDLFNDYLAPSRQNIALNCQVDHIRYYEEDNNRKDDRTIDDIEVSCRDGRSFVANLAVVVTVPLSILNDGDIQFSPHFGTLPGQVSGNPVRPFFKGFKFFIEFEHKFWNSSAFIRPFRTINGERWGGESLYWDYSEFSAPSDSNSKYPLLAGYYVGNRATPFEHLSESETVNEILKLLSNYVGRSTSTLSYRRHFLMNWSEEPFIRGTYSGYAYNGDDDIEARALNVSNRLFFAGEAFPAYGEEQSWVYSAFHSGFDAARQILDFSFSI